MNPTFSIAFPLLAFLFLINAAIAAPNSNPSLPGLSAISDSDIRNSVIAFVNTTSSPGLEGATLSVDDTTRNSNQWRSSLGFTAEVTLQDYIFNGYWGMGIVAGSLSDRIRVTADDGSPVNIDLTRDIISLRGSLGLSFPINENFKLRPVLTFSVSDLQTESLISPAAATIISTAKIGSTTGSIDALYWHWYDDYKLELSAHYNMIYTDTFSEDNPILDSYAWNRIAQVKSRISGPTSFLTLARPWRWKLYANYTQFPSLNKTALGYTALVEVGTGLEWELNIKPLDWFGWRYIGLNAGVITGTNVEGFNVGLTAR